MADREIKTRLTLEGEQQFRTAMSQAASAVKTLNAEEKAAEAQFKATGDAEAYQEEKLRILTEKQEEQKKAVEAAAAAVKQLTEQGFAKNSREMQQWRTKLANAQAALAQTEGKLSSLQGTLNDTSQTMDNAGQASADLAAELQAIGQPMNISGLRQSIDQVEDRVESAVRTVANLGRGIWELEADAANWADQMITEAQQAGLDVETYQAWQFASEMIDTSVSDILSASSRMSGRLIKDNVEIVDALNALGVAISGENGELRDGNDIFWDTIAALNAMDDATMRNQRAQEIFGNSWRNLVPLMNAGVDGWEAAVAEGREHYTLTEDQVAALGDLDDAMTRLGAGLTQTKLEILSALAPTFETVANAMAEAVNAFNDFLATEEGQQMLADLGEALQQLISTFLADGPDSFRIAVGGAKDILQTFVNVLDWIVKNQGLVIGAIAAIAAALILMKVSTTVLSFLEILAKLKALKTLGGVDGIKGIGDIFGNLGNMFNDMFGGGNGTPNGGTPGTGIGTGTDTKNATGLVGQIQQDVARIRAILEGDTTSQTVTLDEKDATAQAIAHIQETCDAIRQRLDEGVGGDEDTTQPVTFRDGDPALAALQTTASKTGEILTKLGVLDNVNDFVTVGDGALTATHTEHIETHTERMALQLQNISRDLERVAWYVENSGAIRAGASAQARGLSGWAALLSGGTMVNPYTGDIITLPGFLGASGGMRASGSVSSGVGGTGTGWDASQYEAELAALRMYDLRGLLTEETARMLYEGVDAAGAMLEAEQIVPQVLAELAAIVEVLGDNLPELRMMGDNPAGGGEPTVADVAEAVEDIPDPIVTELANLREMLARETNDADLYLGEIRNGVWNILQILQHADIESGGETADAAEDAGEAAAEATEAAAGQAHEDAGAGHALFRGMISVLNYMADVMMTAASEDNDGAGGDASWGSAVNQTGGTGSRTPHYIKDLERHTSGVVPIYGRGGRVDGAELAIVGEGGAEYIIPTDDAARAFALTMQMLGESDTLRRSVTGQLLASADAMAGAVSQRVAGGGFAGALAAMGGGGAYGISGAAGSGGVTARIYMDSREVGYMVADTVNDVMGARVSASRRGD